MLRACLASIGGSEGPWRVGNRNLALDCVEGASWAVGDRGIGVAFTGVGGCLGGDGEYHHFIYCI